VPLGTVEDFSYLPSLIIKGQCEFSQRAFIPTGTISKEFLVQTAVPS
jgi:hypothetical protein